MTPDLPCAPYFSTSSSVSALIFKTVTLSMVFESILLMSSLYTSPSTTTTASIQRSAATAPPFSSMTGVESLSTTFFVSIKMTPDLPCAPYFSTSSSVSSSIFITVTLSMVFESILLMSSLYTSPSTTTTASILRSTATAPPFSSMTGVEPVPGASLNITGI